MSTYSFTIYGAPRTKKNHGIHLANGHHLPNPAWVTWVKTARVHPPLDPMLMYLHQHWRKLSAAKRAGQKRPDAVLPPGRKWRVCAVFFRDRATGDLDNFIVGLGDLLQDHGIIDNDKHIVSWDGSRLGKDARNPRVELTFIEQPAAAVRTQEGVENHG
jgi:hypothetical protein